MKTPSNQSGSSIIELLIIAVIVAGIGFGGYLVYHRQHTKTAARIAAPLSTSSTSSNTSNVAAAPTVNSTSDLDKAQAALNQTDPSGSNNTDTSQLDSQLANF